MSSLSFFSFTVSPLLSPSVPSMMSVGKASSTTNLKAPTNRFRRFKVHDYLIESKFHCCHEVTRICKVNATTLALRFTFTHPCQVSRVAENSTASSNYSSSSVTDLSVNPSSAPKVSASQSQKSSSSSNLAASASTSQSSAPSASSTQ